MRKEWKVRSGYGASSGEKVVNKSVQRKEFGGPGEVSFALAQSRWAWINPRSAEASEEMSGTQCMSGPPGRGPGPSPLTKGRLEKTILSTIRSQDRCITKSMWQCGGPAGDSQKDLVDTGGRSQSPSWADSSRAISSFWKEKWIVVCNDLTEYIKFNIWHSKH